MHLFECFMGFRCRLCWLPILDRYNEAEDRQARLGTVYNARNAMQRRRSGRCTTHFTSNFQKSPRSVFFAISGRWLHCQSTQSHAPTHQHQQLQYSPCNNRFFAQKKQQTFLCPVFVRFLRMGLLAHAKTRATAASPLFYINGLEARADWPSTLRTIVKSGHRRSGTHSGLQYARQRGFGGSVANDAGAAYRTGRFMLTSPSRTHAPPLSLCWFLATEQTVFAELLLFAFWALLAC